MKTFKGSKKFLKIAIPFAVFTAALLIWHFESEACPFCNTSYFNTILENKDNSLVAKELLTAIKNQGSINDKAASLVSQLPPEYKDAVDKMNTAKFLPASYPPPPAPSDTTKQTEPKKEFIEVISRDEKLPIPPTSYMPQDSKFDKEVTIELSEGEAYLGKGVMFKGFVTNGTIPGPTITVEEGDVVKFNVVNKGSIPHGASIHSAYTQTSKYLGKIEAGKTKSLIFRCTVPGVYLYHCAPGGHAIPMHIIFGQYGMMVVKPKKKFKLEQILNKKPDAEIYLTQHEFYSNGKDAINSQPLYTTFNGKLFRYVEEPIKVKPGDYVRIYFLNAGPNLLSTFHIVGIVWDFAYWQGNPDASYPGGQSVTAGPTDSWVVEFRVPPDEGSYLMLSHAVGSTDRGAIGILQCDKNAQTPVTILSDGPKYSEKDFAEIKSKVTRVVSPFEPGTPDVDPPEVHGPNEKEVTVKIIGNSFYPKVLEIEEGTTVTWQNEDVFAYMEGEFAGIHNVISYGSVPEVMASPMLAHAEKYSFRYTKQGTYTYMCTPHPYMKGEVRVKSSTSGFMGNVSKTGMGIIFGSLIISIISVVMVMKAKKGK
ncbi:MAG: multicopper oxidase domain-containing protein [Ignavibacteria bacterium]|nr:multicopper oxidase domain-containing protein [Ignavibacteria bacterium]